MLIEADARAIPLQDACVQCVVTSPPYFGLRDYRITGQIGLEPSPADYIAQLVWVFREVRRVLKADGTVWLNLGDSLERKQLLGVPWRVAFALQADGWYLRSDIIWNKPNPMPESVTDRPTKSHEYLFLLTKSERYYYDADAIREENTLDMQVRSARGHTRGPNGKLDASRKDSTSLRGLEAMEITADGRNKRSVWTVATMPYAGAHFATMPEALVEPCVMAGSKFGDLIYDPFSGSGTVLAVAERLGRRSVGTDLNPAYNRLAKTRTAQRGLKFTEAGAR